MEIHVKVGDCVFTPPTDDLMEESPEGCLEFKGSVRITKPDGERELNHWKAIKPGMAAFERNVSGEARAYEVRIASYPIGLHFLDEIQAE